MYIQKAVIQSIRCIEEVEWTCPPARYAGWHVILGDNGSGKSTFLRALALALLGEREALALRADLKAWLRSGATEGQIDLDLTGGGPSSQVAVVFRPEGLNWLAPMIDTHESLCTFSAAYGPFRRFAGGDPDAQRLFLTNPRLGAHISVFGEHIALTEALEWLKDLRFKELENAPNGSLLRRLTDFINQDGFLPHGVRLREVTSDGVYFADQDGVTVPVDSLSDGYRSILSMTFELIRQMERKSALSPIRARLGREALEIFRSDNKSVTERGVVLIDEVDAHLHPSWQKEIGFWLTRLFPNIQFIVTTHSPLICHAAKNGSIFKLAAPGSGEESRMIEGTVFDRLVYGDILEAYGTEAFGTGATRSDEAHEKLERLAALNVKELRVGLTDDEKEEQERLRSIFPTVAHRLQLT